MSLWILEFIENCPRPDPWSFPYDVALGFIVRAETEQQARELAAEQAGDEGRNAWLDPDYSTCMVLTDTGEAGVILRDFKDA